MSDAIQTEAPECLLIPYFNGPEYDLDPIRVILYDYGDERGRMIVVECYGDAYSHYWGRMGKETVREFVCSCSEDYLVGKLLPAHLHGTRLEKLQRIHLQRIVRRVREALRGAP